MIEITSEAMGRAQKLLAGINKGTEIAISNALNRALLHAKTQAFKEVRKVYSVKRSALDASTATKVKKASVKETAGYVLFSGVKIPLYQFNVSLKDTGESIQIKAGVKKGNMTEFHHAFITQGKWNTGIFKRESSKRLPISEYMGLSSAQMVNNEVVMDELSEEAQKKVEERVEHEMERILNGYGG